MPGFQANVFDFPPAMISSASRLRRKSQLLAMIAVSSARDALHIQAGTCEALCHPHRAINGGASAPDLALFCPRRADPSWPYRQSLEPADVLRSSKDESEQAH